MEAAMNVPVDDPNADTEWNDILRQHGVIPEKAPSPTAIIEEAILEAQQRAHDHRLDGKSLEELNELEDEEDEEFLDRYRKKRVAELSKLSKKSIHGQVYHLQKPDYPREVTDASNGSFVLVHLKSASSSNVESRRLTEIWRELAQAFADVKFCEIQGNMCINAYPEKNCPTILVYHQGGIVRQMLTLKELQGPNTTLNDLEQFVVDVGAVDANDSRVLHLSRRGKEAEEADENEDEGEDEE
ncbi:MAG: hypothetical protein M1826_000504 [Phylliscum demangeonii]|nr:MAG: hypothetical protein M1826_000504 [Phylliscum demangeonii]